MKKTGFIVAFVLLGAMIAIGATTGMLKFSPSGQTAARRVAPDAQASISQGKIYLQQHNILAARDQFQQEVEADPNNQEANLLYGVTRVFALVEDGQTVHTSGLDSVREILELAGISFQTFNIYGSEMSIPKTLAATTPRTGAVLDFLKAKALPEIDGAIANLAKVTDTAFISAITPAAINKSTGADIVVDYADALVIKAMLNAAKCKLNLLLVYGLDASLPDIQAGPDQLMTYKHIFQESAFLAVKDATRLTTAKAALIGFIDAYTAAVPYINARNDAAHHLFVVDAEVTNEPVHITSQRMADIQNMLNDIRASLNGPHLFAGTAPQQNRNIDLSRFFNAGSPINIRAKLADNTTGTVLPDPTIGGIFPQGFTGLNTFISDYGSDVLGVLFSGRETPFIRVDPDSLFFVAKNIPLDINVENHGTSDLHVSSMSLNGANAADFALSAGSCGAAPTLAAGASCTATILMKPTATDGQKTAALQVVSDDISATTAAVNILGWTQNSPVYQVSLSANPPSPRPYGTVITVTAAASGGSGSYQYQFTWRHPVTGVWTVGQAYSATASWSWNTVGLPAGAYTVQVWARNVGSTASYEAYKSLSYTLTTPAPASSVTLTPDKSSPQPVGSQVTFNAQAAGGSGAYQYQFWLRNTSGAWSIIRPYSSSPAWTWNTAGLPVGNYSIQVWAKNTGSTASYEAYKTIGYSLSTPPPASSVTLTPDKTTPQPVGSQVTFNAQAAGGSGAYQYQFWVKNPVTGAWSVSQAYGSASSWSWNTTGLPAGVYGVQVWAKNSGSTASYEAYKNISYTLVPTVNLTATPASPQPRGASVTFNAAVAGGSGTYLYQFFWRNPSTGAWTVGQAYSTTPSWTWNTSALSAGTYPIQVWAKKSGSTAAYDYYKSLNYVLQ